MKSLLSLTLLLGLLTNAYAKSEQAKYKLTWVLAHEPVTLFEEAAKKFSSIISEKTKGQMEVQVITAKEFNGGKDIPPMEVYEKVRSGEIQMSQGYTTALGLYSPVFWVLDLPFLFKSHDHATSVLEGPIGKEILASLDNKNLKGLAFTYSGGYRIIPAKAKEIHRYEDIKGMKVSVAPTPVFQELYKLLGATPVKMNSLDLAREQISKGISEASESTYPRYLPLQYENVTGIVNETNHSLFLTSLIINKDYYNSLPKNIQKAINESALEAARLERHITISSHDKSRKECQEKGIKVVQLSEKETERFKKAVEPLYYKFGQYFRPELVTRIQNTK